MRPAEHHQHHSPFQYPGGKTWFAKHLRRWLEKHKYRSGHILVEPFAGGATASLLALKEGYVDKAVLIEKDDNVAAVWETIINGDVHNLIQTILDFRLTDQNVQIVMGMQPKALYRRAFRTLLQNRLSFGGIMLEPPKLVINMKKRWHPEMLAARIMSIARYRDKLHFIYGDAFDETPQFLSPGNIAFVDPPYPGLARNLYAHGDIDHRKLFDMLQAGRSEYVITYNDNPLIRGMATENRLYMRSILMNNNGNNDVKEIVVSNSDLSWLSPC